MPELRTYRDAVAIVTGGASGIGASLARELARRGATVVIADRQIDLAGEVVSGIVSGGGKAEAHTLDVRDFAATEALATGVFERQGRLDYLFNNAGTGVGGEVLDYGLDEWRYVIEVNLMGVLHGVQAVYRRMVGQGFVHIVNTASMAGLMPAPFTTSYCVAKHGIVGLTRALRVEGAHYGVRVSAFCPGVIRTPLLVDAGRYGRTTRKLAADTQTAMWERLRPMDPDRFARKALDQVARNREIIILPGWWRFVWWLNRLSPGLGSRFGALFFRDLKRRIEAAEPRA